MNKANDYTRDCLDPWTYLEVFVNQNVRPCCILHPYGKLGDGDLNSIRKNAEFVKLRQDLLNGHLNHRCANCHIRAKILVPQFRAKVRKAHETANSPHLGLPLPLTQLRIDLSTNCNLRCDYCAVSSPIFQGRDLPEVHFADMIALIKQMPKNSTISVNGHGETTFHPKWRSFCQDILDAGHRPEITTNLGLHYSDQEIETLAQFRIVQVSLDSTDEAMMRDIRKAVKVSHVFENIRRIRAASKRLRPKAPVAITFSVGIYDPAVWGLRDSIQDMLNIGGRGFTFWNLVEMPHQQKVQHIRHLGDNHASELRQILSDVRAILKGARAGYHFAGDFNDAQGNSLLS